MSWPENVKHVPAGNGPISHHKIHACCFQRVCKCQCQLWRDFKPQNTHVGDISWKLIYAFNTFNKSYRVLERNPFHFSVQGTTKCKPRIFRLYFGLTFHFSFYLGHNAALVKWINILYFIRKSHAALFWFRIWRGLGFWLCTVGKMTDFAPIRFRRKLIN